MERSTNLKESLVLCWVVLALAVGYIYTFTFLGFIRWQLSSFYHFGLPHREFHMAMLPLQLLQLIRRKWLVHLFLGLVTPFISN